MPTDYRHILVAVDFMPDRKQVTDRARQLAGAFNSRISLVHIVEYFPLELADDLVLPQDIGLEDQLLEMARSKLAAIAQEFPDNDVSTHVELGQTSQTLLHWAEEQRADLILLGRHGRHGFSRILGSTASAILNQAPCDVLAVRIQPTNDAAT